MWSFFQPRLDQIGLDFITNIRDKYGVAIGYDREKFELIGDTRKVSFENQTELADK